MKVLHYSLGLPPFRSGGLTKYSFDLMISQARSGLDVILLYPGHYNITNKTKISFDKNVKNIDVYEILNPLPVPLVSGIKNPLEYVKETDEFVYLNFLKKINPDIIHMHTLMGIHREFIQAAKQLNIKIIFTTHDYFGICPKVNLIDYNGELCENTTDFKKCVKCNQNGFSLNKIRIMQSLTYRLVKKHGLIEKVKKLKGNSENNEYYDNVLNESYTDIEDEYSKLNRYYMNILESIDYIHFNSSVTKDIYSYYGFINGDIINISHNDIYDNRQYKKISPSNEPLQITYMGDLINYKGFFELKETMDRLISKGVTNWKLNVYGNSNTPNYDSRFYNFNGKYSYSDLNKIFEKTDLMVIPSICKETFGFIGLEALSYAIPIIVSENTGFKDIIEDNGIGVIIKDSKGDLENTIEHLINNREKLQRIHDNILNIDFKYTMNNHLKDIECMYLKVIEGRDMKDD